MKLNRFVLDKRITEQYGIDGINMDRLGDIVALIGKNGSGKTRILNLLTEQYLQNFANYHLLDNTFSHLPGILNKGIAQMKGNKNFIFEERFVNTG